MALIACKECGEKVSTKAKKCPKCGAKAPKKTSLFTWLVLIFIVFSVYIANQSTNYTNATKKVIASNSSTKAQASKSQARPKPQWRTSTSKHEMTGKFSAYAQSPSAAPSKKMDFPYHDVNGWIGVGCNSENEWVYFGFDSAPNLTKDKAKDGYNLIKTRVKWNNQMENVSLTQDWGSRFIHFQNDSSAIAKIAASKTAMLELQWHGEQPAYLTFTLNGSSKAISEIRAKCASAK